MYLLQSLEEPGPRRRSSSSEELFPPGLRLHSQTAEGIYELLLAAAGEGFRWCFPDSPEILWGWQKLRAALESGSGWTLPDPGGRGLNSHARLTVQLVDRSGSMLDPISFIAEPTGDAMLYELSGVSTAVGVPMSSRRLAVELSAVVKEQKEKKLRERAELQRELSATAREEERVAQEIEDELEEEFGGADLVALFEELAIEESQPRPTARRLTHWERMDRLQQRRQGRNPRTI